jgi:hypothetical protein
MAKRIEINGEFFRERRGELVKIPAQWVGKTLHSQTKQKRLSKAETSKLARASKPTTARSAKGLEFLDGRHNMIDEEA